MDPKKGSSVTLVAAKKSDAVPFSSLSDHLTKAAYVQSMNKRPPALFGACPRHPQLHRRSAMIIGYEREKKQDKEEKFICQ